MKPGTNIKYREKLGNGRQGTWKRGKIKSEYIHFYLVQAKGGYRECLNKRDVATGDADMEVSI